MSISDERDILELIRRDEWRMRVLKAAACLDLSDWWIGAGFVRTAVWDAVFYKTSGTALPDVDLIYFDRHNLSKEVEKIYEASLTRLSPGVPWSVKNQARMHLRNGDEPYDSCAGAIMNWPETATAVAVRLKAGGSLELMAPFGIADLAAGIIRPTPRFRSKMEIFRERQSKKGWSAVWPGVQYSEI